MSRLRVLCYHDVRDAAAFGRQLDELVDRTRVVSLEQVHAALAGGPRLPSRAVLLTFDDGLPSHLDVVAPALQERGLTGVFYVVLGVLGTDVPFWWDAVLARDLRTSPLPLDDELVADAGVLLRRLKTAPDEERQAVLAALDAAHGPAPSARQLTPEEVRRLAAAGHAVGNHSWTHPLLDRLGDDALSAELERAHEDFRALLPDAARTFAYPNGNHDARTVAWLARAGYASAFLFDHATCGLDRRLELSRLRVDERVPRLRWVSTLLGLDALRVRLRPGAVVPAQRRLPRGAR